MFHSSQQLSLGRRLTRTMPPPLRSYPSWAIKAKSYEANPLAARLIHLLYLSLTPFLSVRSHARASSRHSPCSSWHLKHHCNTAFSVAFPVAYRIIDPNMNFFLPAAVCFFRCSSKFDSPLRLQSMGLKTIHIVRHGFRLNWHTQVW